MITLAKYKSELVYDGFSVIDGVYSLQEVNRILEAIDQVDTTKDTFRKSSDLFAIRQFLKEVPEAFELIFTDKLRGVIQEVIGRDFFVVKSIYFDKPASSNWYVPYHQDLTISVDKKVELEGFGPWTRKQQQFAVQPPIELLEGITTIRIHLDDTDENNGALKVVPGSHLKKIYRPETVDWAEETEMTCCVQRGGIMLMKPLVLHSSSRTVNDQKRRVVHIEFCDKELPEGVLWSERMHFS